MNDILNRKATAYHGREGYVESETTNIHLELATPTEMTGKTTTETNSFELVAMAYSACMSGAVNKALELKEVAYDDFKVEVVNHVLKDDSGGKLFEFDLNIILEGLTNTDKNRVVDVAMGLCPFSKAIKGNVKTNVHIK